MGGNAAVITSSLAGRTVVRVPFLTDMRERLRACGGEPRWDAESGVWTMPRRTLLDTASAMDALFPGLRVRVEVAPGEWQAFTVSA